MCCSFLPVSSEAEGAVAGQLSVGAVASVEAGVVSGFIAAHRNRKLRPSGWERKTTTSHLKLFFRGMFLLRQQNGTTGGLWEPPNEIKDLP